jgi:hypothetical protein
MMIQFFLPTHRNTIVELFTESDICRREMSESMPAHLPNRDTREKEKKKKMHRLRSRQSLQMEKLSMDSTAFLHAKENINTLPSDIRISLASCSIKDEGSQSFLSSNRENLPRHGNHRREGGREREKKSQASNGDRK